MWCEGEIQKDVYGLRRLHICGNQNCDCFVKITKCHIFICACLRRKKCSVYCTLSVYTSIFVNFGGNSK